MIKLLLDENLPKRLKYEFPNHIEVFTVNEMAWKSMKNGDLLKAMEDKTFDGLITADQNLTFQQNLRNYSLNVYIIKALNNRFETIFPLIPKIITAVDSLSTQKIFYIE